MKQKHIEMFMRVAEAVAETSSCIRLKVGSVIVKDNRIISTGYNGLPSHIDGDCEDKIYDSVEMEYLFDGSQEWEQGTQDYLQKKYPYWDEQDKKFFRLVTKPEVRHSEKNCLLNLAKSTESSIGGILFCTHACCKMCSVDIVDSGIKAVYYRHDYRDSSGIEYLKQNGVEVYQI